MKQVVVLFGGSFNPPTYSHLSLAEQVCSVYKQVEKVLFMPVGDRYPKKDLLPAVHRVEMLRRVCEKNPYFEVSTIEVDAPCPLDSIETLRRVQNVYQEHDIWLTIGSDNLKLMATWPCYKEILQQFKCVVLERGHDRLSHIISNNSVLRPYQDRLISTHELIHSDCNATMIRQLLREGRSIRYLVPDEIYYYIKEKGLYTIVDTK